MRMNEKTKNKIVNLYRQCKDAYDDFMDKNDSYDVIINDVPWPGPLYDSFNVPAELLFCLLCEVNKNWVDHQSDFLYRLLTHISFKKNFNVENFIDFKYKKVKKQKFTIYLELFYRIQGGKHNRIFPNTLKIDDVVISWATKQEMKMIDSRYLSELKNDGLVHVGKMAKSLRANRNLIVLDSTGEKNIHPIKIETYASNSFIAFDLAMRKMQILLNCLNYAQIYSITTQRFFGGQRNNLSENIAIVDTGVYLIASEDGVQRRCLFKKRDKLPNVKVKDTNMNKKIFKELYETVVDDSPVKERSRKILEDFMLANTAADEGLRHLCYWRCLEHATRYSNGKSRNERDILAIFKNYYSNDKAWHQMAEIIRDNRNGYVHEGIIEVGSDMFVDLYTRWAKSYAVVAVNLMIVLHKERRFWDTSKKIDYFFDFYSKSDEELAAAGEMLRMKNKFR